MFNLSNITATSMWDLGNFFTNLFEKVKQYGGLFISLLGLIMVIAAVYQTATGLMSKGQKQTNWLVIGCLFFIGAALMVGGITLVLGLADGGHETLKDLGQ